MQFTPRVDPSWEVRERKYISLRGHEVLEKTYTEPNHKVALQETYIEGKLQGPATFRENGRRTKTELYDQGELVYTQYHLETSSYPGKDRLEQIGNFVKSNGDFFRMRDIVEFKIRPFFHCEYGETVPVQDLVPEWLPSDFHDRLDREFVEGTYLRIELNDPSLGYEVRIESEDF